MRVAASADLIDDREYAAPPELVFEAWTKAEHFARWFAPDNVDVPLCEIDARPGGVIRFQHRWPEGSSSRSAACSTRSWRRRACRSRSRSSIRTIARRSTR